MTHLPPAPYRAAIRRAAAPARAPTPVGMPPIAPADEELLSAEAVPLLLEDEVRVLEEVPVDVVSEPVEVVLLALDDPVAVPVASEPVDVAEAVAPVPVAVPVVDAETLVTVDHWLLKEASRLDCSNAMLDCSAWASDCAAAPTAVAVAWYDANWLLIEATSLA